MFKNQNPRGFDVDFKILTALKGWVGQAAQRPGALLILILILGSGPGALLIILIFYFDLIIL